MRSIGTLECVSPLARHAVGTHGHAYADSVRVDAVRNAVRRARKRHLGMQSQAHLASAKNSPVRRRAQLLPKMGIELLLYVKRGPMRKAAPRLSLRSRRQVPQAGAHSSMMVG